MSLYYPNIKFSARKIHCWKRNSLLIFVHIFCLLKQVQSYPKHSGFPTIYNHCLDLNVTNLYRFIIIQKTPSFFSTNRSVDILKKRIFKIAATFFKDAHREKAPSSKTPGLTKSMNMDIGLVHTSNQLFIRGS